MRRTFITTAALVAVLLAGAAGPALAGPIDAAGRRAAVEDAARALRERYIFPEVGEQAAAKITAAQGSGAYDAIGDTRALAERLTADLQGVTHDKHMRVVDRSGPPPAPPADAPKPPRSEAGVVRADKLAGGIGYIEVNGFPPPEVFKASLDRAMTALAGSRAVIVDVRRNGGGDPASVAYLVGFFTGPGKVKVNDIISRKAGTQTFETESFFAQPTPVSFKSAPVYVLTSGYTFSGGEEFAYDVQALKLGTLVGETTGGGANPGAAHPVGPGLMIFVPDGRAQNPITGGNWEGKGVVPDVAVPAGQALSVALARLGQAGAAAEVEAVSQARLFTPRTTAQAGSEAAVRRTVAELAAGKPDYSQMSPSLADQTRETLPQMQKMLADMGAVKSVSFAEVDPVGADAYDVTFEKGRQRWLVVMAPDGKLALAAVRPL